MSKPQAGFTLIEVLATSAATGIVILAATSFMLKSLSWFDELNAKIEINRHARETFDLLAYGGRAANTGKDGTNNVYSIRGSNKEPSGKLRTNENALQYKNNNLTLQPDSFAPITVVCKGNGIPIPDCKDNHSTQSVAGWIGKDIKTDAGGKSINDLTVNVTFTITNPFQAQRALGSADFTDTYRTVFTFNRKEDDPH